MTTVRPLPRTVALIATAGLGVLTLAGCGSSSGSTATPATSSALAGGGAASGQPGGGRTPGVSGTVAALDGSTLQVQGSSEQTAVVYTKKTTVTARVATTSSALAVGDCVSVRAAATPSASTSPTAANAGTGTLAASTVTILTTTGGCDTVARGGFPGGGFPGGGAGRPSGIPSDAPSGSPSGGRPGRAGFGTTGEVTALSSGTFTVASRVPDRSAGATATSTGGTATSTTAASATTTPVTVTYTDATTFLTTTPAKATSIKVGSCVRATGRTDDTGALTATTLVLSQPVDGSCTIGVRGG